jgi:hypothetical protein
MNWWRRIPTSRIVRKLEFAATRLGRIPRLTTAVRINSSWCTSILANERRGACGHAAAAGGEVSRTLEKGACEIVVNCGIKGIFTPNNGDEVDRAGITAFREMTLLPLARQLIVVVRHLGLQERRDAVLPSLSCVDGEESVSDHITAQKMS